MKSIDFKEKKTNRNEETNAKSQRIMIFKLRWEKKCMAENQQQNGKNSGVMRS